MPLAVARSTTAVRPADIREKKSLKKDTFDALLVWAVLLRLSATNAHQIGAAMNSRLAVAALATIMTWNSGMAAEDDADIRFGASPGSVGVSYYGDNVRVAIGVDDDGDAHGELFGVFGADENSAWIGELWVSDQRGGVKLNYHWLRGADSVDAAATGSQDVRVFKSFLAVDQNQFDDRKISAGIGSEGQKWFWGLYAMTSITGRRLVNESLVTEVETLTVIEGNQEFAQDQFTDTTTRFFERPYNHGVGARIGRFFDQNLWRVRGGVDFEQGDFSADQLTFSLGVEKFFANSGHSLALTAEYLDKSGRFEVDHDDTRAVLLYRYSFGEVYKPRRDYVERRVERRTEPKAAVTEQRLVKNRVTIERELLFDFDRSALRPGGKDTLQSLQAVIQSLDVVSPFTVAGHTCDIGTELYNQGLSERRANAVADFMFDLGTSRESMIVSGAGENQPAHPNDGDANRQKNRRVEIEFVTVEGQNEQVVLTEAVAAGTEVTWEREPINDPAWLERALRNPIQHKRTVDVYRFEETSSETRLGELELVNTFPEAVDDAASTPQDQAVTIDVLANDQDADGDQLSIVAISQPANGTVGINGDDSVTYTPLPGFFGTDTFTYTVADPRDAQSTATVTIEVIERPPLIANDDSASTVRNASVMIDVLDNDEGDAPSVAGVGSPANGTVELQDDIVTYTPNRDFTGNDTFTYEIGDALGNTAEATVAIIVDPFNQSPVAVDDTATTRKNTPVVIDVLANDSDPDGDALTIISVTQITEFGFGEITPDNQILYTPMPGWWGGDELSYTISDGFGGEATATIVLDVVF
jgi:outer membrane protein OmpA-like peptidoglycan-associated protein